MDSFNFFEDIEITVSVDANGEITNTITTKAPVNGW